MKPSELSANRIKELLEEAKALIALPASERNTPEHTQRWESVYARADWVLYLFRNDNENWNQVHVEGLAAAQQLLRREDESPDEFHAEMLEYLQVAIEAGSVEMTEQSALAQVTAPAAPEQSAASAS